MIFHLGSGIMECKLHTWAFRERRTARATTEDYDNHGVTPPRASLFLVTVAV